MIERDRLDEHRYATIHARRGDEGAQHLRGVVGSRWHRHDDTRQIAEDREAVVIVEVSAEALLVAEARDADDHRVLELTAREEGEGRRFATELVLGVVQVGQELDLGNGEEAHLSCADGEAEDGLLVEERVEDASGAECFPQAHRHAVHAAFLGDILAEEQHRRVFPH